MNPSSGEATPLNLPKIQMLLGPYPISSIQMWLRMRKLPFSAGSRADIAKRVHDAVQQGKITTENLMEGLIGIEESRSKTVHLVRIDDHKNWQNRLEKQLDDLGTKLSSKRILAENLSQTPKMIYAINNHKEFRMKWGEVQIAPKMDKKTFNVSKDPISVIFVFILNKLTGIGQLRYDAPQAVHSHMLHDTPTKQAYLDFYREKCENLTGLSFGPLTTRERLREILLKQPPIVVPTTMSTIAEDDGTVVYGSRSAADPRTRADFKADMKPDAQPRTFEKSPLRWQHTATNYKLYRNLWCSVDAAAGTVTFDAECVEAEVDYVISQLV